MLEISKGTRLYKSKKGRKVAVEKLINSKHNYFVGFLDVNDKYPYGLSFGKAKWVEEGTIYRKDC